MEGELKHLTSVLLWVLSSLSYCYFVSSNLPKGIFRLFSILPIFYLFYTLPHSLSYVITSVSTTFLVSWIANFKLLLFAFNKGPLSTGAQNSLPLFLSIATLPIVIKKTSDDDPSRQNPKKLNSAKNLPQKIALQVLLLAAFVTFWGEYKEVIHPKVMQLLFVIPLFLVVDIITSSTHVVVRAVSGLELEPASNEPYLSTSIQNFWGRRWNVAASNTLRLTVYEPTRAAALSSLGKDRATYVAYLATFIVSGFMHELIIYNLKREATKWEMISFFVIHGSCIVIELIVKRAVIDKYRLPTFVSRLLTTAFVLGTGSWLFIPPFSRHSFDVRFIEEIASVLRFVTGKFGVI